MKLNVIIPITMYINNDNFPLERFVFFKSEKEKTNNSKNTIIIALLFAMKIASIIIGTNRANFNSWFRTAVTKTNAQTGQKTKFDTRLPTSMSLILYVNVK